MIYCKETDIDDDYEEDIKARECLAKWPYENIWKKNAKARHLFNCKQSASANEHDLWPINENKTVHNTIKIKKGERCRCKYQLYYDGQCGHELRICFEFKENHFNERWYTTRKYKSLHPTFDQMPNISTSIR